MPLWDSVQRSLEKASQEAARIARTQRLRSIIDGLSRQLNTQNNAIVNKAMDLFVSGQLTQSELIPLCQEMINLHQQMNQAQNELKQLQMQASQASQIAQSPQGASNQFAPQGTTGTAPYPVTEGNPNPAYPPPPPAYQSYMDSTNATTVAPPPPGMEPLTVSSIETIEMGMGMATPSALPHTGNRLCAVCRAEIQPNVAFCHNCGSPVQASGSLHLPTMRGGTPEQLNADGQATQVASSTSNLDNDQGTVRASTNPPLAQVSPLPSSDATQAAQQDKEV